MFKTLVMDSETREMRVRYHDLWRGEHEVTEYRVTDARIGGEVVRNLPDLDGRLVLGTAPSLYIRKHVDVPVYTQETSVGPTVKTPCPKASNARRKCALCKGQES